MQKKKKYLKCEEYKDIIQRYPIVLAIHYNNTVNNHISLDDLRLMLNDRTENSNNALKKNTIALQMVKNNLIKKVLKNTKFNNFSYVFEGPTLLLYTEDTSTNTCQKIIRWYSEHKHLENLGGIFYNTFVSRRDFDAFIELPTNTEFTYLNTISTISSPINELISTLMLSTVEISNILNCREEQLNSEKSL